jgi:hypothetical protein
MPRTCGASAFLDPRFFAAADILVVLQTNILVRVAISPRDLPYPPGDGASAGASEGTSRLFSRRLGTAR